MSVHPPEKSLSAQRVVRVFVSSTFRDMQAERDELVKFIFPQLRKLCEQRGVIWGEVDLRWGITDEQKAEGKVLPICMEEIHRSRPFFIGILGERYGWISDDIPEEMIKREPWMTAYPECSVTELEILHGALNNSEMAEHAFFYFRDPAYIKTLPPGQQSAFREEPTSKEIKKYGKVKAKQRAKKSQDKIKALKRRIRKSGFPIRENFSDPKQFGQWVLSDLTSVIDRLYPEGSQPDPLDLQAAEHEAFAANRLRVYIGRKAYSDQLDNCALGDGPPLAVLGESGSGKSALLANWAVRYHSDHPGDLVIKHFIGSTPASTNWAAILRRILGEFKRHFNIWEKIPDQPDQLQRAFSNWMHRVDAGVRVVLILDALDQLEDREGAPDLVWLPKFIPKNVRLIVSTLPGRPFDEITSRGWHMMNVQPLELNERKELIREYLILFTKALSPARLKRIASASQCQNPLFLRALLDELRLFGFHEWLDKRIDEYLKSASIPDLYKSILKRCEQDYERDRPGLVKEAMGLLWAARRGLSEAELMDLLGEEGLPLPRAHWSPLFLALEQAFVSIGGLISFFHDYIRQAVEISYLSSQSEQQQAHLRIADYFENQPGQLPRRIDELPWQLAKGLDWERLYSLLSTPDFFLPAWRSNEYDIKSLWVQLEEHSAYRLIQAYRTVIDNPGKYNDDYVWPISSLLTDKGHFKESLALQDHLIDQCGKKDPENLARLLVNKAVNLYICGDIDNSAVFYEDAQRIFAQLSDLNGLQGTLGKRALILNIKGDVDGAMALLKKQEQICRQTGNLNNLEVSLFHQANILYDCRDLSAALVLYEECERICRQTGMVEFLSNVLGAQANILNTRGYLDKALALYKEGKKIQRQVGDLRALSITLGNEATIFYAKEDLDSALKRLQEAENICLQLGLIDNLSAVLSNQASIYSDLGKPDKAMELYKKAEKAARKLGNLKYISASLMNQATILEDRNDLDRSLLLYKEAEEIDRKLGHKEGIAQSLGHRAHILNKQGKKELALEILNEALEISQNIGVPSLKEWLGKLKQKLGGTALPLTELPPPELIRVNRDIDFNDPAVIAHFNFLLDLRDAVIKDKTKLRELIHKQTLCVHCQKESALSVGENPDDKSSFVVACAACKKIWAIINSNGRVRLYI